MIKTLSPHYISVPFTNPNTDVVCESYTLKLYIWSGLITAIPLEPVYEKTKLNQLSSNGIDKINISRLVNDYIDFNIDAPFSTSLENSNNQVWVRVGIVYSDQPLVVNLSDIELATKGYGYFQEGTNPQIPSDKILLSGDEFKVDRNGFFVLPIYTELDVVPDPTFATIVNINSSGCIFFVFNETYLESSLIVQTSTNSGASWSTSFGAPVSPRCGSYPIATTWYRLKSAGAEVKYSNVYIITI